MATEKDRITADLQKYIKKSQWDKAIQTLGRLAVMEPNNAVHRLRTGDYYLKLGYSEKAVTAYEKAAEVFATGGFVVKALAAYKMILRLDPQNENAHAKMQGLHGQAREQAAVLQAPVKPVEAALPQDWPTIIERSGEDVAVAKSEPAPVEAGEALEVGLVGLQPTYLDEFQPQATPPEPGPVLSLEAEAVKADESAPFELERTAYAESDGPISEPSAAPSEPALESPPQEPRPTRSPTDVIPLFSSLTPEEFSEIVERMVHLQYPAGYRIVKEGEAGDSVYLISQGAVSVTTKVGNREIALSELKDNDFFGEVGFLTGRPRTASVVTQTDTEILELRGEDLKAIVRQHPRVREVLEGFYKARVRDTLSKIKHTGP